MELKVSVNEVSPSQKKIVVEIPSSEVEPQLAKRYKELSKQVKLKGFRPGKVPMRILKSYYQKAVEGEVSNEILKETYPKALDESGLKPLVEADIEDIQFEESGELKYTAIVEVAPPFEVDGYFGVDVKCPPSDVSDEEIQAEIEKLRERHSELAAVEEPRPIENGDVAIVDFTPFVGDTAFERGKSTDYMLEVGKQTLHPDFDANLIGHQTGDSLSFEVDYPEDAPTKEIAGKRVRFEVAVKEVKVKTLPELNDDFAVNVGQGRFDSLDQLKEEISTRLRENKEQQAKERVRQQIRDKLLERVDVEIADKVVDREVGLMIEEFKQQFRRQNIPIDENRIDTPEIRAEYRPRGRDSVKWRLILDKIAEIEGVELNEMEIGEVYQELGKTFGMEPAEVEKEYGDSAVVDQAKIGRVHEKVLAMLEDEAVCEVVSEEAAAPAAE